jgi:hypothetical protein
MQVRTIGGVAAAVLGIALMASVPSVADQNQKHDSNTLHKIGSAIQYTTRKDTENLSVDVHRGEGHKSVETLRNGDRNAVITPGGHKIIVYRPGQHPIYAHRTYRHSAAWRRRHHVE